MKRVLLPIGILVGCIVFALIIVRSPKQVEEAPAEIIPVAVRVIEAELNSVQLIVESQGKVQPARTASLSAAVEGPVAWISPAMEAGGYVPAGAPLMRLDATDFETALERSRASMQQAEAEAEFASSELNRFKELAAKSLASASQLQSTKRGADVAISLLANAQASYNQALLDLERTEIKAPFNAIIESRDVELGQYVNRAQAVAVVHGADEVEVRVPLAIRQLGYLDIPLGSRGQLTPEQAPDVTLKGYYGGQEYNWVGDLVRTEAVIDADSNTVQTIIRVTQPISAVGDAKGSKKASIPLPIGLFVQAKIQGRIVADLISLPRSVIRNNNQVLVVDAENKMHYRDVEIYRLEESRVLISAGLLPGELICISPIQAVVEGMSVQPVRAAI
ncbi:MAG: RND family efflux transporter MFP subunit [Pseudohongiellaceae bacterium]|jgi:RND family efflux transporter MFP subunit